MAKIIQIQDPVTTCFFTLQFSNAKICFFFAGLQLVVAAIASAQHVYSILVYNNIFLCWFGKPKSEFQNDLEDGPIQNKTDSFLAADVIIFDFGLFHELLGIPKCVANRFDGGYMRGAWCVSYIGSLLLLMTVIFLQRPRPKALLPILLQQSVYMLGLIMLTLATLRKLLWALFGEMTLKLFRLIFIYFLGGSLNCYFGITLWHFYWHWKSAIKAVAHADVSVSSV